MVMVPTPGGGGGAWFPAEVLVDIAVDIVLLDDPLGPPSNLLSLLLTCKHINYILRFDDCRYLYGRIFRGKFDSRAVARRRGVDAALTSHQAAQLKAYCVALKRIRSGDLDSEYLEDDLWTAFVMCLENDGRNEAQLSWARLDSLLEEHLRTRLWVDTHHYGGWPPEHTKHSLAIWLYWLRLDDVKLDALSSDVRKQLLDAIRCYAHTALRYPSFFAPDNHFKFPLSTDVLTATLKTRMTPHGHWPQYRDPSQVIEKVTHYSRRLELCAPILGHGAKLLYMTLDELPYQIPLSLARDREHALALGWSDVRATQADFLEANAHRSVKLLAQGDWDWYSKLTPEQARLEDDAAWRKGLHAKSALLDELWNRLAFCRDPWADQVLKGVVYMPGSLSGLWQGRMHSFRPGEYSALTRSTDYPGDIPDEHVQKWPVYFNLREHHCIMPKTPMPTGGDAAENDEGIYTAWFPSNVSWTEREERAGRFIELRENTNELRKWEYETYAEGRPNSHDEKEEEATQERAHQIVAGAVNQPPFDSDEIDQVRSTLNAALGPDENVDQVISDALLDANRSPPASDDGAESDYESEYVENSCSGICDVIVTGESLPRHGQAWNHFHFYGRVRPWDGLIAIVRVPVEGPHLGSFVGSWRLRANNRNAVPLEGPFAMSKVVGPRSES
ncbi:predicted protein [Postia placenta Mad-698-R]|nr:predicted protein [Postia placenta Mad-698-R]